MNGAAGRSFWLSRPQSSLDQFAVLNDLVHIPRTIPACNPFLAHRKQIRGRARLGLQIALLVRNRPDVTSDMICLDYVVSRTGATGPAYGSFHHHPFQSGPILTLGSGTPRTPRQLSTYSAKSSSVNRIIPP